jgi:hypothetical protein
MPTCPRCEANVPEGNDRCRVCGYGLPGTDAEKTDPKRIEPVATESRDDTTGVHSSRADVTGQTAVVEQVYRVPSRLFPASAILLAFLSAVGIVLAVIALTAGNGSNTRTDLSTTTSTSKPAVIASTSTTLRPTTTTSSSTTTTYYYVTYPPRSTTTSTTSAPTTTTTLKKPPPTSTTSRPTTTTTTAPRSTTTTAPPTTLPPPTSTIRHHH